MKRIKRIVALALATVMMMAMSTVAFAAESTSITVTNLSANETTKVSIYKIVEINQDEWKFSDWVSDDAYSESDGEYKFDYDQLVKDAAETDPDDSKEVTTTSVEFTGVAAGAYLVLASGTKTTYNTMVAVTYKYDKDVFAANAEPVVAKSSTTTVVKDTSDTFVSADEEVTFTITTVVPYIADDATDKTFVLYENPTNLKNLAVASVTLAGESAGEFSLEKSNSNDYKYTLDLTDLIADENANAGKEVVVTLTANVDGANGYKNTAWTNYSKSDVDYDTNTVEGFTGSFILTKVDATGGNTLSGAKFSVSATENGDALTFVKDSDGVYTLSTLSDGTVTELEVASDGTLKVQGLAEGTYYVTETQAPEGYSINSEAMEVEINPEYAETTRLSVSQAKDNVELSGESYYFKDSKLSTLPFTGGMGTTIFTVLGVAIMAIAAALYFATKKNSKAAQ